MAVAKYLVRLRPCPERFGNNILLKRGDPHDLAVFCHPSYPMAHCGPVRAEDGCLEGLPRGAGAFLLCQRALLRHALGVHSQRYAGGDGAGLLAHPAHHYGYYLYLSFVCAHRGHGGHQGHAHLRQLGLPGADTAHRLWLWGLSGSASRW